MTNKVIGLYGVPRSGTSWLGQIFDSCENVIFKFQPLFSYAFKNYIKNDMSTEDIEMFFDKVISKKDDFLDQVNNRSKGIYPIYNKYENNSDLVYKEANYLYSIPVILKNISRIKMIAIVRNPYDVMESWINASSEFKPEWDIQKEWQFAQRKNNFLPENFFGYYKWKEAVKMFCEMEKLYPDNFRIVQYELLVNDVINETKKMFDFADLNYSAQTNDFVNSSQSVTVNSDYSVYKEKKEKTKRKYYIPDEIKEKIKRDLIDFEDIYRFGYNE